MSLLVVGSVAFDAVERHLVNGIKCWRFSFPFSLPQLLYGCSYRRRRGRDFSPQKTRFCQHRLIQPTLNEFQR